MLAALLSCLLATSNRPIVISLLLVLMFLLLIRAPCVAGGDVAEGSTSGASCGARHKTVLRSCSISTVGTLINFDASSGAPRVDAHAVAALAILAARYDMYLITQLEEDSDTARNV